MAEPELKERDLEDPFERDDMTLDKYSAALRSLPKRERPKPKETAPDRPEDE